MLVIRLSRTGRSKVPTYRIVVAEKSAAVKGKYHEAVGHYNPAMDTPELVYDKERIQYWVSQGARPSETLARVLYKDGFEEMLQFFDKDRKFQKKSKKEAPAEEKPAEGGAEEAPKEDAPAAETKEEAPKEKPEEAPAEKEVSDEKKEEAPKGEASEAPEEPENKE